jgi:pyrimidine-specific ribonucleoside hydrolase
MKKIAIFLFSLFLVPVVWSQPRPVKFSGNIIIDTDCGFDDFRAITLLLSRPEIIVKGILTTDGSLPPSEGFLKVYSLLYEFKRDSIPVGCGERSEKINPEWRQFNRSFNWGRQNIDYKPEMSASELLLKILNKENKKITLVCLGPLSNIEKALKSEPESISKIERIVWYNESVAPTSGFNYECDKESANLVLKSGIRVDIMSNLDLENAKFDTTIVSMCNNSWSEVARVFSYCFNQNQVKKSLNNGHFFLGDDLVAVYLTNPELFSINAEAKRLNIRFNKDFDINGVREVIQDMIKGSYTSERNIVFNTFPIKREFFNYDIRPVIDTALALYGPDEWKANVMTDEFHGHLGVFSIVGAKMGIKAREIFGVGQDMLDVVTYAGSKPPYSCLTDGIQVSTGATLGMGTIHLAKSKKVSPAAVFTYNNRSIKIILKREYFDMVDTDIKEGISKFGLMDDGYWKLIRHNALKYWLEWDRNKIFDIEEIPYKKQISVKN